LPSQHDTERASESTSYRDQTADDEREQKKRDQRHSGGIRERGMNHSKEHRTHEHAAENGGPFGRRSDKPLCDVHENEPPKNEFVEKYEQQQKQHPGDCSSDWGEPCKQPSFARERASIDRETADNQADQNGDTGHPGPDR
jgi:hypothetical protein